MTRAEKAAAKQRRTDAMEDYLYHLALRGPDQMTQLNAAVLLHGIYNGADGGKHRDA